MATAEDIKCLPLQTQVCSQSIENETRRRRRRRPIPGSERPD